MRYKICVLIVWTAILLTITTSLGTSLLIAKEPIVIGVLHSEKFPYATMMKNSYLLAMEEIERTGQINGTPLKLKYINDKGDRGIGEKTIRHFIKKMSPTMLIGAYHSTNAIYLAGIANRFNVPLLVCTAADDRITQRGYKNVFRLNPPASEYAKGLEAFFLEKIKPQSVSIVYENSPYGTSSALKMMWFCREHDIPIHHIMPYHKERTTSEYYQKIISPLKENPPDILYMVSYLKDAVMLVKTIRKANINALLCGGAGGFTHNKFLTNAKNDAQHLLTATLWCHKTRCPEAKCYYDRYVNRYGAIPDYHGAEAYSAILVAADALRRTTSLKPKILREALSQTNMLTPLGPVEFKSYGKFERQNSPTTMVLQVVDNDFYCVWPKEKSTTVFKAPAYWRK